MRPIFEFRYGQARPSRPAFSRSAAFDRLLAPCIAGEEEEARLHASVLHARSAEDASVLAERLCSAVEGAEVFVASFTSVMLAHTGPGLVGVAWWWEPTPRSY